MFGFGNFKTLAAAAVLVVSAGVAQAASVTFGAGSFVDQGGTPRSIFDVVISDIVGGVNVAVSRVGLANGDVLLLGLEGFNLAGATFAINPDPQTSDGITAVCTTGTTDGCGPNAGGKFDGGAFNTGGAFRTAYGFFDTIIRIGRNGSTSGLNNGFDINITNTLATALDFTVVGIRAQTTSGVGAGVESLKIYNDNPTMPPVPVPAAGLMLLGALGGLAALRRRRKAA